MNIEKIVDQALQAGYLTPSMEAEVGRLCEVSNELTPEEYKSLDKLMGALLTGEIVATPKKQFINVMEELVVGVVISKVAEIETSTYSLLDVGDISAYALNRLPPLYATTEEGAEFQRQKAQQELQGLIDKQVDSAISLYLDRPEFYPERQAITKSEDNGSVFEQVSKLLQSQAALFEGD